MKEANHKSVQEHRAEEKKYMRFFNKIDVEIE
jgi:hypothetical protein